MTKSFNSKAQLDTIEYYRTSEIADPIKDGHTKVDDAIEDAQLQKYRDSLKDQPNEDEELRELEKRVRESMPERIKKLLAMKRRDGVKMDEKMLEEEEQKFKEVM